MAEKPLDHAFLPLDPHLSNRYSCRSYKPESISDQVLQSLFEAARWAPSSYNDQPWCFLVAKRENKTAFETLLSCTGGNLSWAKDASVLMACCTAKSLSNLGAPNPHAWHDLGLAVMSMAVQGVSLGIQMREIAGIEPEKIRALYKVPNTHDIVSGLAIGIPCESIPPSGRSRKETSVFVFEKEWGCSLAAPEN